MPTVPDRPLSLGERLNLLRPKKTLICLGTLNVPTVEIRPTRSKVHGDLKVITPPEVPLNALS